MAVLGHISSNSHFVHIYLFTKRSQFVYTLLINLVLGCGMLYVTEGVGALYKYPDG